MGAPGWLGCWCGDGVVADLAECAHAVGGDVVGVGGGGAGGVAAHGAVDDPCVLTGVIHKRYPQCGELHACVFSNDTSNSENDTPKLPGVFE